MTARNHESNGGPQGTHTPRGNTADSPVICANSRGNSPLNGLPARFRYSRLTSWPSSGGIGPLSAFPWPRRPMKSGDPTIPRSSTLRFASWPSSGGIGPVRRFSARFISVSVESWPSSPGMAPVRWLCERFKCSRFESWPSSGGIAPFSPSSPWGDPLPERSRRRRFASWPSSPGIGPVNPLPERSRCSRLESRPNSGGIVPPKWPRWPESSKRRRLESSPSSGGIVPLNSFSERTRAVTRPAPSVSTPCHSASGAGLSHPEFCRQVSPPVASKNTSSAGRSVAGRVGGDSLVCRGVVGGSGPHIESTSAPTPSREDRTVAARDRETRRFMSGCLQRGRRRRDRRRGAHNSPWEIGNHR